MHTMYFWPQNYGHARAVFSTQCYVDFGFDLASRRQGNQYGVAMNQGSSPGLTKVEIADLSRRLPR